MSAIRYSFVATILLSCLLAGARATDDQLTRTELARLGKAATALVETKAGPDAPPIVQPGYGSAFCIHPSGLFLTNEHVVHPRGPFIGNQQSVPAEVTLILNPGEKTEKSYTGRVVRTDKQLDLALVRAEGAKNLPTLSLGSDEKLEELMEVVALGFPFGTALSSDGFPPGRRPAGSPREYPSVSVNAGSITALRLKDGALDRIQLDATINPGNSGGPVLDKSGKVVGVVVSGVVAERLGRTGISYAVPASHLNRFLARPDIEFTAPIVNRSN
jgi:S1-C subfamily serine protease